MRELLAHYVSTITGYTATALNCTTFTWFMDSPGVCGAMAAASSRNEGQTQREGTVLIMLVVESFCHMVVSKKKGTPKCHHPCYGPKMVHLTLGNPWGEERKEREVARGAADPTHAPAYGECHQAVPQDRVGVSTCLLQAWVEQLIDTRTWGSNFNSKEPLNRKPLEFKGARLNNNLGWMW